MKKSNRRSKKRLAYSVEVKIYRVDKNATRILDAYLLETKDLTPQGLFLKTARTFPIGTELILEIKLPHLSKPIYASGEVAWVAKPRQRKYYPGMGVHILEIKRGDGKRLQSFLQEKFRNYHHAVELKDMYMRLKEMAARLCELEEEHPQAEEFRKVIDNTVKEIDNIAHVIDKEVWEIKRL